MEISLTDEDKALLWELRQQQKNATDPYSQIERWNISSLLSREISQNDPPLFSELLPLWVGQNAIKSVTQERISTYERSIQSDLDFPLFSNIVEELYVEYGGMSEWVLSTIYTTALLNTLIAKSKTRNPVRVIEVGGGFGLLGYFANRFIKEDIHYTLIDALPDSLIYTYRFYKDLKLKNIHFNKYENFSEAGFCILPAWRVPDFTLTADAAINISSLQEMPDETAEAYMKGFDYWLNDGGGMIFINSRDFYYARDYRFPVHFKREYMEHTPRSRTMHFPVEMFIKSTSKQYAHNSKVERRYLMGLIDRIKHNNSELRSELKSTRSRLNSRIKELTKQRDSLLQNASETMSKNDGDS